MAVMKKPKLLLLDEHTAALDPKTAAKVLALSDKFIAEDKLTAMMITHNMKDAITYGNRLIMMNNGQIILDVSGEEKKKLTVEYLLEAFSKLSEQNLQTIGRCLTDAIHSLKMQYRRYARTAFCLIHCNAKAEITFLKCL